MSFGAYGFKGSGLSLRPGENHYGGYMGLLVFLVYVPAQLALGSMTAALWMAGASFALMSVVSRIDRNSVRAVWNSEVARHDERHAKLMEEVALCRSRTEFAQKHGYTGYAPQRAQDIPSVASMEWSKSLDGWEYALTTQTLADHVMDEISYHKIPGGGNEYWEDCMRLGTPLPPKASMKAHPSTPSEMEVLWDALEDLRS